MVLCQGNHTVRKKHQTRKVENSPINISLKQKNVEIAR